MEITSTVATLDSHYLVLDSEVQEITKDLAYLRTLTKRYGPQWEAAIKQLKYMKSTREQSKREIEQTLDLFKLQLPAAKGLCKRLERNGCRIQVASVPSSPAFMLTVQSPILANSTFSSTLNTNNSDTTIVLNRISDDEINPLVPVGDTY
eukprot:TRINITY_DN35059_c0_g1_i1.p1 TRINITY_DN35059_c0_g1~~TRINITY_DN35059_c0_g1_i1.p1  ORF type:complete len:150 (+),score=6.95 TRINITY_DN35059_c0_g1_i1:38-487(+)